VKYGVLTRKRLIKAIVIGLLGVAVPFVLIGWLAERPYTGRFDWELASIFGTALGTTLLALATGALAYTTSGDVRATWELANLTKEDQLLRERPIVVAVGSSWEFVSPTSGRFDVSLWNVGLGPALYVRLNAEFDYEKVPGTTQCPPFAAIPPSDTRNVPIFFTFEEAPHQPMTTECVSISGTYTDRRQQTEYEIITAWMTKN
jgi:hypothetical protein